MQRTSPSVRSYGKPPINTQALSLYWLCQDETRFPDFSSCSLNFLIFFTFLKSKTELNNFH